MDFRFGTIVSFIYSPPPRNINQFIISIFSLDGLKIRDIMAAAEKSKTEYRERLDRTVQLMNRLNLPPKIQDRIRMWFTYSWSTQKTLGKNERSLFFCKLFPTSHTNN